MHGECQGKISIKGALSGALFVLQGWLSKILGLYFLDYLI